MSASTQGQTIPTVTGNGHVRGKPGRKPGQKAAAKPTPPLAAGQLPTNITGSASQTNVAERRIGPMPIAIPAAGFPNGSINWLYMRQQECEIELRLIRTMIAQFGPRRAATGTTKPKSKSKKRRASPVKQAA